MSNNLLSEITPDDLLRQAKECFALANVIDSMRPNGEPSLSKNILYALEAQLDSNAKILIALHAIWDKLNE